MRYGGGVIIGVNLFFFNVSEHIDYFKAINIDQSEADQYYIQEHKLHS